MMPQVGKAEKIGEKKEKNKTDKPNSYVNADQCVWEIHKACEMPCGV